MMELFSIELMIAVLFFISFFLMIVVFVLVKKMNRFRAVNTPAPSATPSVSWEDEDKDASIAKGTASDIIQMLEPLMQEAHKTAIRFDEQIKEKKRLLKELNDALDTRIININLLLSRAETLHKKLEEKPKQPSQMPAAAKAPLYPSSQSVVDQQNEIIALYNNQTDIDSIAQQLSIPKGEVQLVIDLKKKFLEMEQENR